MKWLINYLRECFCKHEFIYEEGNYKKFGDGFFFPRNEVVETNIVVSVTCKKCGYHKKYCKF